MDSTRRQTSERARYAFYSYPLYSHAAAAAEKRKSTDDGKKSRVGRWEKKTPEKFSLGETLLQ